MSEEHLLQGQWDALEPGDLLGSYRIVQPLEAGGMAMIYVARHLKIQREVALKVLRPELATRAREVRRFLEEARAIQEISHPNIVEVYDFVEQMDREPPLIYMVMELLRGRCLADRIREQGPLPPTLAVQVGCQVADALEAVHAARLLHRDLKPRNIFLLQQPEPRIKLLDFGLTLPFGGRAQLNLTDPGTTMGTPEYMSPEQVLGEELDPRCDIYMLGMVLYEALCGELPFTAANLGDLLVKQVKELPRPLRERAPAVPEALDAVVLRCLEKERERRFQSAHELKQALELSTTLPQGETVPLPVLRRLGLGRPGAAPGRRRGMALASIALLLLAGGVLLTLALIDRTGPNAVDHGAVQRIEPHSRTVAANQGLPDSAPSTHDAAPPPGDLAPPSDVSRPPAVHARSRGAALERGVERARGRAPRIRRWRRRPPASNKRLKTTPNAPTIDPWKLH